MPLTSAQARARFADLTGWRPSRDALLYWGNNRLIRYSTTPGGYRLYLPAEIDRIAAEMNAGRQLHPLTDEGATS